MGNLNVASAEHTVKKIDCLVVQGTQTMFSLITYLFLTYYDHIILKEQ